MLFFLLAGHALADYSLQTEPMAVCKCRRAVHPLQASVPWFYWLTAHAGIHGAVVGGLVRWFGYSWDIAIGLGMAETFVHWMIDFAKCGRLFGIHVDQALHAFCKLAWWGVLVAIATPV